MHRVTYRRTTAPTTLAQKLYLFCYTVKKEQGLQDRVRATVLAVEPELTSAWSKGDRRTQKSELRTHAAQFDALAPGLCRALRASCLASRAVGGGWSA
ncbi:hypothetical protein ACFW6C_08565 [Streptomyces fungicidicus]|uniref:hypothetical protein n=1 Tax=Streptomyces fungicidicus TaxID=68203 RepID=UPI0036BECA54